MLRGAFSSPKESNKKNLGGKKRGSGGSSSSCNASTMERHSMAARESQEAIAAAMAGVTPGDTVGLYDVALKLRLSLFTEVSMRLFYCKEMRWNISPAVVPGNKTQQTIIYTPSIDYVAYTTLQ